MVGVAAVVAGGVPLAAAGSGLPEEQPVGRMQAAAKTAALAPKREVDPSQELSRPFRYPPGGAVAAGYGLGPAGRDP